jgi:hypothetical protein
MTGTGTDLQAPQEQRQPPGSWSTSSLGTPPSPGKWVASASNKEQIIGTDI